MSKAVRLIGAIDLGGTKIYSAVLDASGAIAGDDLRPTGASDGPDAVIGRLIESLHAAAAAAGVAVQDLDGAGVVAPGPSDPRTGHVMHPPNLPGWHDVALAEILTQRLGVQTLIENDANAAALGEYVAGAGRGASSLIYITISTGIGGGFVFDGQLYRGAGGGAGEVGHTIVEPGGPRCGCGNDGCLEAIASGTALAREGAALIASGRGRLLRRLAAESGGEVNSMLVALAAQQGDADAAALLERAARALGIALGNLVNLINPDVIVIGGGAAHIGAPLLEPAEAVMRRTAFPAAAAQVTIRRATLEYAAIRGIASLVHDAAR